MPPTISVLQGAKQFFTGSQRKRDKIERGRYVQAPHEPQAIGIGIGQVPSPTCRRSIFGLNGFGNFGSASKPKKTGDVEMTAQMVVQYRSDMRKHNVGPVDEHIQRLREEMGELNKVISHLDARIGRRRAKLEKLKAKDDEEKWEDELFETRLEELRRARALLKTQPAVFGADVQRQIEEINQDIADVASLAVETPTMANPRQASRDIVKKVLGEDVLGIFQRAGNVWDNKQIVQAILRVTIVHSCAKLMNSWHPGNPSLDNHLDRLYERILHKEDQMVAGKWRQITFEQLPHGPDAEFFQQFVSKMTIGILAIASFAGWGGDTRKIQQKVHQLVERAERIRTNLKSGINSADLQPLIAMYGAQYDRSEMKDASHHFGIARVEDIKSCHVLGSTAFGLKVRRKGKDDNAEFEDSESKTRVLLIESFVVRRRLNR